MSTQAPAAARVSPMAAAVTVGCVLVVAVSLTWTYLSMRAVMNVGGSCADGGPYIPRVSCPDGVPLAMVVSADRVRSYG